MKDQFGIDKIIQAAIRQGDFENLPGQGQPFEWDPNEFTGNDWDLAHHLLKENGFAPEFIEIRKSIEADLEKTRADLRQACKWHQKTEVSRETQEKSNSEFRNAQQRFQKAIAELNLRIRDYNLIIPSDHFYRNPLKTHSMQKDIEDQY
jgi:DnaJ family protein C protein 28